MNVGMNEYNIYCDESCHLENDHQKVMVLGASWCPANRVREISSRIREIKQKHGFNPNFEIKWTKVSPSKEDFYKDIIDYFFDDDNLHFRALIVPDKSVLNHRIRWPRPIIEHSEYPKIKLWENERRGEKRICIWFEEIEYLVVLAKRKDYILFWTAYPVLRDHRKKKLNKEYEEYLKAGDAQKDGTVTPSTHGR